LYSFFKSSPTLILPLKEGEEKRGIPSKRGRRKRGSPQRGGGKKRKLILLLKELDEKKRKIRSL